MSDGEIHGTAADKIVLFLKSCSVQRGTNRVMILHMLEIVYRGKGGYITDLPIKEFIRYGKEVEQLTELDFIHAIQRHLYDPDEPISFPLEKPDFVLAPNGEPIWRKKT